MQSIRQRITDTGRWIVSNDPGISRNSTKTLTTDDPWILSSDDLHPQTNIYSTLPDSSTSTTRTPVGEKRQTYPKRDNMGECPALFGKVTVFVAFVEQSYKTHYAVAQKSLKCYLKSTNYSAVFVDLFHDKRVNRHCKHDQLFFRKHCAASVYLQDTDWMLVLDADAGVVNPNHCIEEWIDERVDILFYERFFNWEIASGNYLVKNTRFSRDFLMKWADWQFIQPSNWNGADNGVLQLHILKTVMPEAKAEAKACDRIWHRGTNYETYMAYVTCVKINLGATRLFPGKIRIYKRAHGWVRDAYLTGDAWSPQDFMLHGWKVQDINIEGWESPYEKVPDPKKCGIGYSGWYWREKKKKSVESIREMLADFEDATAKAYPTEARIHPYLIEPDVGEVSSVLCFLIVIILSVTPIVMSMLSRCSSRTRQSGLLPENLREYS